MAKVLLLGPARDAARGVRHDTIDATTVQELLAAATERYGSQFADIVAASQIWVNGEPTTMDSPLRYDDEVAVVPPVSGG